MRIALPGARLLMAVGDGRAAIVSIEVDGRQRYLLETDKWREMLGASQIINSTVCKAVELFAKTRGLFLVSPVSGAIRAWSKYDDRAKLLAKAWEFRQWLAENGVEHTCAYLECSDRHFCVTNQEPPSEMRQEFGDGPQAEPQYASLAWVHHELTRRIDARKEAKDEADARPGCSLFAPCRLHGLDVANLWTPRRHQGGDEPRRDLESFRAAAKYQTWENIKGEFLYEKLQEPVKEAIEKLIAPRTTSPARAITFRDLADQLADEEYIGGDQYVGFLKADGDGFSDFFKRLDWNAAGWCDKRRPWKRNSRFSIRLKKIVDDAFSRALVAVIVPTTKKAAEAMATSIDNNRALPLPVLPQLVGGDDLWTLASREVALAVATMFADEFEKSAAADPLLSRGRDIVNQSAANDSARPPFSFSISIGVAFMKASYPAHAMHDAAEWLLSDAKAHRHVAPSGACLDWHWIQSSLNEEMATARLQGFTYEDAGVVCRLTTRPWTLKQTTVFLEAAGEFAKLPRRKREQLDSVLRRGALLSTLAWEAWWKSLRSPERNIMMGIAERLTSVGFDVLASRSQSWDKEAFLPWIRGAGSGHQVTPFLDLVGLDKVLSKELPDAPTDVSTDVPADA